MVPNPAMYGAATLVATQSLTQFQAFLPKLSEIRRADADTDLAIAADVRMGEVAAVAATMGVGVIASSLTGSAVPAVSALIMCAVLVTIYESTLRADRPMETRLVEVDHAE